MCHNKLPNPGMKMKNEADVRGLPEGVLFLLGTFYRCTLCECHIYGRANMQQHVNTARHQAKLWFWKENRGKFLNNADVASANMQNDHLFPQDVVMTDNPNIFWCETCSVKISGHKCVFQHVEGLNHNKKKMDLLTSTSNFHSNSSKSNSKVNSNKGLQFAPTKIKKESLPSSSISQENWSSDQSVNIQESETAMAKKKKKDRKNKKEVIHTSNIVSASTQKIQSVVKISSSGKKIGACEIYPEKKKSPGLNDFFECDSCNIDLRGYTELLSHVMAGKCPPSTDKKLNEPKNYKFAAKSPGKLMITRFVEGEEVEAVDIPEEFFRISRETYYCLSCHCTLIGGGGIFRHAKDAAHRENAIKRIEEDKDYIFTETSPGKWKIVRFFEGKEVEAVDIPEIFMHIASTNYYCLSCSYDLIGCEAILKHAKVIAHGEDFIKKYEENNSMNKSTMIDEKSGLIVECADVQELPPHIVPTENENGYWCQICGAKISSYKCISEHENGAKHKKKLNSFDFTFDQSLFPHITVISEGREDYWCEVCSVKFCGCKTLVQHVNSPKHTNKVENPLNLAIFGDCSSAGVSNEEKGKSISMILTSNGIDCKTNHCLPPSSLPSPEDYVSWYGKIGLNSMAGHKDGELNNNKEFICESVKSICSPGDEVFMTLCRICKEVILGDELTLIEHFNSTRHATRVVDLYLQGPLLELDMKLKFDKHDAIKYFIADKQAEGDESLINVVEVLENETRDTGICFTWCRACCIKIYDDSRLDEHLKSRFHLKNFQGKFIIGKFFDGRDDNDDSELNERIDRHKYYPEGIKEIHGEDYFLCTLCNGLKLFDENSLFEHVKSLVHMNNQQRSLGNGETGEDEDFFNEINWKTSGKSAGRDETVPNSEESEKASQDTEVPFSEGSCSSLSYGQREDDSIELYPSDGSVDGYRTGDEEIEFEDESSVIESASTSQMLENIRVPKKRTAASLGEVYNIKGTDIWVCLTCQKHHIYTPCSMNEHLTSRQHSEGKKRMLDKAPKQLKMTSFKISPEFRSKGIFEIPTKSFAVCALCKCELSSKTQVEAHLSDVQHQALKNSIISRRNGGKLKSIWPLSSHKSLPDGIEEFYNKDFVLCTLCRKHFHDRSEMEEHVRHPDHMKKKSKVIFKIDDDEFRCKKCGINLSGYSSLVNHLNSPKHM